MAARLVPNVGTQSEMSCISCPYTGNLCLERNKKKKTLKCPVYHDLTLKTSVWKEITGTPTLRKKKYWGADF